MPTPKQPKAEIIQRSQKHVRCATCIYKRGAVAKWIHDTLTITREAGELRPYQQSLYDRAGELFPGYTSVARHVNTLNNHLIMHEPEWDVDRW